MGVRDGICSSFGIGLGDRNSGENNISREPLWIAQWVDWVTKINVAGCCDVQEYMNMQHGYKGLEKKKWKRTMCRVNVIAWSATRLGSIPCACKEQKMIKKSLTILLYQVNDIIIKLQENWKMEQIQLTSCSTQFDSWSFDSCLQSKQINLHLYITNNYRHNTNHSCYNWRKGWKEQTIHLLTKLVCTTAMPTLINTGNYMYQFSSRATPAS